MLFTGLHVPYTEGGHQSTFLTRLLDIVHVCMFQLSRAAHQLLGRLHTLLSFHPTGEH